MRTTGAAAPEASFSTGLCVITFPIAQARTAKTAKNMEAAGKYKKKKKKICCLHLKQASRLVNRIKMPPRCLRLPWFLAPSPSGSQLVSAPHERRNLSPGPPLIFFFFLTLPCASCRQSPLYPAASALASTLPLNRMLKAHLHLLPSTFNHILPLFSRENSGS